MFLLLTGRGGPIAVPRWHRVLCCGLALGFADLHGADAADLPAPRSDENSRIAHADLRRKAALGGVDLYFIGDSITRRWGCGDPAYATLLENWRQNFHGWNAGDFGWGGDEVQHMLWRLDHGELDGVNPKVFVILAGTNNIGKSPPDGAKIAAITRGIAALIDRCRRHAPDARIVVTAIFPRNDAPGLVSGIEEINRRVAGLADGEIVHFLDVKAGLATPDGTLLPGMMIDRLHPTVRGYQVWADGLKPLLTRFLGPPAATDHAPPPTADPSLAGRPK